MNTWKLLFLVDSCLEFLIGLGASFLLLVTNYHRLIGLKQCTCHFKVSGVMLYWVSCGIASWGLIWRLDWGRSCFPALVLIRIQFLAGGPAESLSFLVAVTGIVLISCHKALSMGSSHGTAGSHRQHRTESPPKSSITTLHNVTIHIPSPLCLKHVTGPDHTLGVGATKYMDTTVLLQT